VPTCRRVSGASTVRLPGGTTQTPSKGVERLRSCAPSGLRATKLRPTPERVYAPRDAHAHTQAAALIAFGRIPNGSLMMRRVQSSQIYCEFAALHDAVERHSSPGVAGRCPALTTRMHVKGAAARRGRGRGQRTPRHASQATGKKFQFAPLWRHETHRCRQRRTCFEGPSAQARSTLLQAAYPRLQQAQQHRHVCSRRLRHSSWRRRRGAQRARSIGKPVGSAGDAEGSQADARVLASHQPRHHGAHVVAAAGCVTAPRAATASCSLRS